MNVWITNSFSQALWSVSFRLSFPPYLKCLLLFHNGFKKYNLQSNLVSKMSFKRLQWTDVHISFCFQRSWIQGEVNTWCFPEKISTVWASCEKQHLNLTWILVLFACSKTEFFLKKRLFFQYRVFLCVSTVLLLWKLFQVQKEPYLVQEKKPRISRPQNACPWQVKYRFKSLTWFCSLAGECLDHSTEKGVGQSVSFLLCGCRFFSSGRERLSFFCYFPANSSGESLNLIFLL